MVLIVEDHAEVRASLRNWLSTIFSGHDFVDVSSGEEAVVISEDKNPVLVLMDIALPGITGIEATRQIKAARPETHVVMLTIHDESEYRVQAEAAGASAFVVKDRAHSSLMPVLKRLLSPPDAEGGGREEVGL